MSYSVLLAMFVCVYVVVCVVQCVAGYVCVCVYVVVCVVQCVAAMFVCVCVVVCVVQCVAGYDWIGHLHPPELVHKECSECSSICSVLGSCLKHQFLFI